MARHKIYQWIGLSGVDYHEPRRVRRFGRVFEYGMLIIAICLLLQWQMEIVGDLTRWQRLLANWLVWLFFVIEFSLLLHFVKDKKRYISGNWLLPVIILLGIPFIIDNSAIIVLLRTARPLLAILLLIPSLPLMIQFFIDGRLWTTLLAGLVVIIIFGLLVAGVDPNIQTAWDGVWWALATVSTVGYGDVVPTSMLGRLVGAGLVVVGLGVFVVITANFLALTLRKETKKLKQEEAEVTKVLHEVEKMNESMTVLVKQIKALQKRIDKMDQK